MHMFGFLITSHLLYLLLSFCPYFILCTLYCVSPRKDSIKASVLYVIDAIDNRKNGIKCNTISTHVSSIWKSSQYLVRKIRIFMKTPFLRGISWQRRTNASCEILRCNTSLSPVCPTEFSDLKLFGVKSYELRKLEKMNRFSYFEKLVKSESVVMVQGNF